MQTSELETHPWCYDECCICKEEVWIHNRYILPLGVEIEVVCPACFFEILDEKQKEEDGFNQKEVDSKSS